MGNNTSMKTKSRQEKIHSRPGLSRLRLAVAATLFVAAAELAATAMRPPKPPWAAPTVTVGHYPNGVIVDPATNTVYAANACDNTLSLIDAHSSRAHCN